MKAALSLDLDNKWAYMKTHGDLGWESFPSYLDLVVPRALDMLAQLRMRITFFVVGQDAAIEANHEALAAISRAGHEVGNHSFHHEPWLHHHTEHEIDDELKRAEESIEKATGCRPTGFRGPGFVNSPDIFRTLARRGYAYDASTLPTFIGPLARAYYFRTAKLPPEELRQRAELYGNFSDGFKRNRRYRLQTSAGTIAEIPVTTMPGLRLPIHISYVMYLATRSPALALGYFTTALGLCKLTRTEPSILLHSLDFLGAEDCPELAFFPAMNMDYGRKHYVLTRALKELQRSFSVQPIAEFARF
jgi:hypothetical protein